MKYDCISEVFLEKQDFRRRPHGDGGRDSGDGAMELQGSGWKALSGRCGQSAPRAQGRQGSADTMFPEQGENGQLLS